MTSINERQPRFDIEFSSARLRFANKWWPVLAVELKDLSMRAKEPCATASTIQMDTLVLPLDIFEYITHGRVRLGHVRAGRVNFYHRPPLCTQMTITEDSDEMVSLEKFLQKRWSKEVVNTTRFLAEFSMDTLEIFRDKQALAPVVIRNFNTKFYAERGESQAHFSLKLGEPWIGAAPLGEIEVFSTIREGEVSAHGGGNLKEGQFQFASQWAIDRGEVSAKFSSQDVPVQNLLDLAHHWNLITRLRPKIKNQWASCDMTLVGPLRDFFKLPLSLHSCRLYGDLGDIQIVTQKLESLSQGGALDFAIQSIGVKTLLGAFGIARNWGLISQFGEFSGRFEIKNRDDYEIVGQLRDSEFYLSSPKNRTRQKVNSFDLAVAMNEGRLSGDVKGFALSDGIVDGGLTFNITLDGEGVFQLAFPRMTFPVDVQKTLTGGLLPELAVYGLGHFQDFAFSAFDGEIRIRELNNFNWELKNVKLKTRYVNEDWRFTASAGGFRLRPESKWRPFISTMGASIRPQPKQLIFNDLHVEFERGREEQSAWTWRGLSARVQGASARYEGEGQASEAGVIRGRMVAHFPGRKSLWGIEGNWSEPKIKAEDVP